MQEENLEIFCGTMFAGKTTALINRVLELKNIGKSILVYKPDHDDRFGKENIRTHNGYDLKEITGITPIPIPANIEQLPDISSDVIAFDEGQFFTHIAKWCNDLLLLNKMIVVAGLEITHCGKEFGDMFKLIKMAHKVTKIPGKCSKCGNIAYYHSRIIDIKDDFFIGGAGVYEPRCFACWTK